MQQILKRLELIKCSIALDDVDVIRIQTDRLKSLQTDSELSSILAKLDNHDYGDAIVEIDHYLSRYDGMTPYVDEELQGLKLELKILEEELQNQSEVRNEFLANIYEFNIQYNLHLGVIIQKILKRKEEIQHGSVKELEKAFSSIVTEYIDSKNRYDKTKSDVDQLEKKLDSIDIFDQRHSELFSALQDLKETLHQQEVELKKNIENAKEAKEELDNHPDYQQYVETKRDYDAFCGNYQEVIEEERFELSKEEKMELKRAYKKAAKLCHPDIVSDKLKERAHDIISQLNEAYHKRDLPKVKELLSSLQEGSGFDAASDTIDDKQLLRSKIDHLRKKIDEVKIETEEISRDETFTVLQEIDDMDAYFASLEGELQEEYLKLQQER